MNYIDDHKLIIDATLDFADVRPDCRQLICNLLLAAYDDGYNFGIKNANIMQASAEKVKMEFDPKTWKPEDGQIFYAAGSFKVVPFAYTDELQHEQVRCQFKGIFPSFELAQSEFERRKNA